MEDQEQQKKVTVRMLEAYFNAMPLLRNYVERLAKTDPTANRALKAFQKAIKKERNTLDPAEAVFAFAAMLGKLDPSRKFGEDVHPQEIALLAGQFCTVNELGQPSIGYGNRVNHPHMKDTSSRIILTGKQ